MADDTCPLDTGQRTGGYFRHRRRDEQPCRPCTSKFVEHAARTRDARGRRNPVYVRRCDRCGFEFTAAKRSARFCSKSCSHSTGRKWLVPYAGPRTVTLLPERHPARQPEARRSEWWTVLVSGPCARCGVQFTALACDTGAGLPRYCSRRCSRLKPKGSDRFRISRSKRLEIYERDGWCCQLCSESVVRDGDPLGDWAPSLDHIVPQSQGGSDDPSNLRTAHRWCNSVLNDGRKYTVDDLKVA